MHGYEMQSFAQSNMAAMTHTEVRNRATVYAMARHSYSHTVRSTTAQSFVSDLSTTTVAFQRVAYLNFTEGMKATELQNP